MRVALNGIPEEDTLETPEGITKVLIDPSSGLPTQDSLVGIEEYLYDENIPRAEGLLGDLPLN